MLYSNYICEILLYNWQLVVITHELIYGVRVLFARGKKLWNRSIELDHVPTKSQNIHWRGPEWNHQSNGMSLRSLVTNTTFIMTQSLSASPTLCKGNPSVTDGFPSQRASNVEPYLFGLVWASCWTNNRFLGHWWRINDNGTSTTNAIIVAVLRKYFKSCMKKTKPPFCMIPLTLIFTRWMVNQIDTPYCQLNTRRSVS